VSAALVLLGRRTGSLRRAALAGSSLSVVGNLTVP